MEYAAVGLWLALYLALAFVGLPLAAALFPRLADRGAGLALPLVFLVIVLASHVVGRVSMAASLLASLAVLGGLLALASRRGTTVDLRAFGETATVFAIGFLFLVAVRAVDPAITPLGGEKFLDFGMLKAILRSGTIPPEDFWFAGEPVTYYYGGHLLVAQLTRLTGTAPGVAYNLALAGFFATYVSAAYGLAGSIAAREGRFDRRAAALAGFFGGFASNLFTPLRVLLSPLPDGLAESVARALRVWTGRFDNEGALITDQNPFSMWDATGVIEGTIHEMPLFAFVNGDLHAHMMAPPLTLVLVGVLYAYARTPSSERRRRLALLFGVVPAVGGALALVNTWSFPATAGLTVLALLFDRDAPRTVLPGSVAGAVPTGESLRAELVRIATALGAGVGVALLAVAWSLPFWLANAGGRTVALLPDRSSLPALVVVHGTFLLPIALYLGYLGWLRFDLSRVRVAAVGVVLVAGLWLSVALDLAVLGVVGPVLLGGYLLASHAVGRWRTPVDATARSDAPPLPGFEVVPILGAAGLVLVVEFVFLDGDAGPGRFNTVFKVYAQVWALFAVGTAVALAHLLRTSALARPLPRWPTLVRAFVALLVLSTSIYGVIGVGVLFQDGGLPVGSATLDGTETVERFHPDEAPAIDWLDRREGRPTIVTAPGRAYSWSSVPSAFTGIPTVIGWKHHENGFGRPLEAVERRAADVDAIYTGNASTQRRLLSAYDVRYVYAGPVEDERYDRITVDELAAVEVARSFEGVTIYQVDRSALLAE